MRGVGQIDAIESVTFRHAEGNEGEKIGVKRRFGAFYGAKLLKKQGDESPLHATNGDFTHCLLERHHVCRRQDIGHRFIELEVGTLGSERNRPVVIMYRFHIFHQFPGLQGAGWRRR